MGDVNNFKKFFAPLMKVILEVGKYIVLLAFLNKIFKGQFK